MGQPADLFWTLTLREVTVIQKGALAGLRREHNELAWHAWHVAALTRAKKMPPLADLQRVEVRRQSWQEQEAILASW
ncbi:MAG: hypothetical protein EOP24_27675 [Hyphomicrobiales bacterium]|nr:MAG: hypothetical protein EOP24_27675 [Hyphomicrobiales bacterium]